ncbi:hypothetical protein EMCRGX_G034753 [Ephydatia muelleri]
MKWWPLLLTYVVGLSRHVRADTLCPKEGGSSCKCQTPSGLIDLTPLSSTTGPSFTIKDSSGVTYTYNPCQGFSDGGCPSGTSVCQASTTVLGTIGTEVIHYDVALSITGLLIAYSATGSRVQVNLICNQTATTPILTYNGKIITLTVFDLTSCQCCYGGCTPSAGSSAVAPGIIGIVFIVVIIAAIVVYFMAGSIYMSTQRNASGLDIIPNRTFWLEIPFLIWDGMKFSVSPCRDRMSGYKSLK